MGLLGLKQCSLLLLCRWYASVVEEDESKRFVMSRNSHQLLSPMASVLKQSKRWAKLARASTSVSSRLLAPRLLQIASRLCHHQQLPQHQQSTTTSRARCGYY